MSYPIVNAVQWGMLPWPNIHALYKPVSPSNGWACFHRAHSWLREMARSHGFGVPGNADMSNAEEMPSQTICSSRENPQLGPARSRTLWSTSWESVRGSQSRMMLLKLASGVCANQMVMRPVATLVE